MRKVRNRHIDLHSTRENTENFSRAITNNTPIFTAEMIAALKVLEMVYNFPPKLTVKQTF